MYTEGMSRTPSSPSMMPWVRYSDPGGSSTICATAIPLPARLPAKTAAINSLLLMFFTFDALCCERFVARRAVYTACSKNVASQNLNIYLLVMPAEDGGAVTRLAAKCSPMAQVVSASRAFGSNNRSENAHD